MKPIGIYIHIPFCQKKCGYCDFNSIVPQSYEQIEEYLQALSKDIKLSAYSDARYAVQSVYVGGGTPSFLKAEDIERLILKVSENFQIIDDAEITIEANPASINEQKLAIYKRSGVNRVSLGVQSFSDSKLEFLQRAHDSNLAVQSIETLKRAGFSNISIDLIYGLHEQLLDEWEADLKTAIEYEVSHISLYDLKIEKGTPFYEIRDNMHIADNALQAAMYKKANAFLSGAGFEHYEISSFSKAGKKSRHNLIYWYNQEYLGLGAGAFSYIDGERFSKAKDLKVYQSQAKAGDIEHCGSERLGPKERLGETLMLNLRILEGFEIEDIEKRSDMAMDRSLIYRLDQFAEEGFLHKQGNRYKLSQKGLMQYDFIAAELLG